MARPAVLSRLHDDWKVSDHRLSNHPLIDRRASFLAADLCTECEDFVLIVDYSRAVNRSHSTNRIYGPAQRAFPLSPIFRLSFVAYERRQRRERRSNRVENRLCNRSTPAIAVRRHDQEYAAMSVCAHRRAQLDENIQRVVWSIRSCRRESQQRPEQ